ncbi:calcium-binding protein [Kordiimonas laminariae]|uniref:calcium-binding protein n=1 Tax=Kordiimonas laminariae TaxID=2917717 RepID=UPI001FF6CD4C|nr:calcium-binding protein [Kordiimonas laminariae]MCK0068473.1 hypothetical protein [Kordiimonas laminariae]
MPSTNGNAVTVAGVEYTEVSHEVLFGPEELAEEGLSTFPFEAFNNLPAFITSASLSNPLFDFGVAVVNAADESFDGFVDDLAAVTTAALELISDVIVGADGADIQVAVTINPTLGPGTVASATAGSFFVGPEDENGFVEVFTSAQLELQQGVDLNGDTPDIVINVNPEFLLGASFDVDPDRVAVPGVTDFVSVLAHEIIHSLGFLSFRDNTGQDFLLDIDGDGELETLDSTYGTFVEFDEVDGFLTPTFNGDNAVEVYGEAITLESTFDSAGSDVSHFALRNPDGSIADTALALENPSVIPGDIVTLGALELAVFEDLGYTVERPDGIGLVNTLDGLPFTPTVSVNQQLSANGDTVELTLQFDSASLFTTLPSSVGITVVDADGSEQTLRAQFNPGETTVTIELDAAEFFDVTGPDGFTSISGDIDVTLFFPAQAELANGGQTETVSVSANLISGTIGDDVINGSHGNDQLFGGDGADDVNGGNGNDLVSGGAGDDELDGSHGNDSLIGGAGDDDLSGGTGHDLLFGGDGNDTVEGSHSNDTLDGGSGDDEIDGGTGNDVINAGAGSDVVEGSHGNDLVFAGAGDDDVELGTGNDTVTAGDGNDTLDGSHGNDLLIGDAGDDNISAGTGNDILVAGAGSDTLEGSHGNDNFILGFGNQDDADVITDFGRNDTLSLDGFTTFETAEDVLAAAAQVGDDVLITLDAATNQTVLLEDVDLSSLRASNISLETEEFELPTFGSFISNDLANLA